MKRSAIITICTMLLIVGMGVFYIFTIDESEIQKRNNTPAAEALLVEDGTHFTDLQGNTIPVSEQFGTVLVVTSWASWCPQCSEGLIELGRLADTYRGKEVTFLAVNRAENSFTAERYLSTIDISDALTMVLDSDDHYFSASEGYAMPETIVYDQDGQIVLHQRGNVAADEIQSAIDAILK